MAIKISGDLNIQALNQQPYPLLLSTDSDGKVLFVESVNSITASAPINAATNGGTVSISHNLSGWSNKISLTNSTVISNLNGGGVCVTNISAAMVNCIGGSVDEYMEGSVTLSGPAPSNLQFTLTVGYISGTTNGVCTNLNDFIDLIVTVNAGDTFGILTCPLAPFIDSNGATICSVTLDENTSDALLCGTTPTPTSTPTQTCDEEGTYIGDGGCIDGFLYYIVADGNCGSYLLNTGLQC
jgi:hypothetical protein